jgi:archaellum component FlaG (FlaF/FlaG flagellin family)
MASMILFDGPGPLPQQATFNAPSDGPVTFFLSGTARTEAAATLTGITLLIDGNAIGKAMCWANQNDNHTAMRASMIDFDNLTFGEHTIEIINDPDLPNTITDENDYFQVALLY